MALLEVRDLKTYFFTRFSESVKAVDGLSFNLEEGEILGLVGESGSGKSVTAHSILRLVKSPGKIISGSIIFDGRDLLQLPEKEMRKIRGKQIAWIPQNPVKSFSPVDSIGRHLEEMVMIHRPDVKKEDRREFIVKLLQKLDIPDPYRKMKNIPDEWSGGMAQRAMIAKMALIAHPKIIIADEPTTALDATIGAQILHLLASLVKEQRISLILITHDLGIVAEYADRVVVMERGRAVEENSVTELFKNPRHSYTRELFTAAKADFKKENAEASTGPILQVKDLKVYFPVLGGKILTKMVGWVKAVDGVNFDVKKGEILGLAGESGCGKSTLARAVLGLVNKTEGEISRSSKLQAVFQDTYQSLNPKISVEDLIGEGIDIQHLCGKDKIQRRDMIIEMAYRVGLEPGLLFRRRRELSDGQRQRVAIARALITRPELVILDEPISSLDKKLQKQVLELLLELKKEFSLTYFFISHDLNVLEKIADRIFVMYLGKIVESGKAEDIKNNPLHPYTQALFSAQSILDPEARSREKIILQGEVPSPENIPEGCRFHNRCWQFTPRCCKTEPDLRNIGNEHFVACH